ncbi:MAG: hypothetical protein EPN91_04295 [Salinibacterium sp.]|nr:MAG: hypothetical protein EPN91_04295 [Salinibacterium sp.]
MRRRVTGAAWAVVAVLVLCGCAGIPTSGGVQSGPIITEQLDPEFVVLPSGPRAGATQEEILADFMQAMRGPQGDYAIAREFLSADLARNWDPDARVLIRTSNVTTKAGPARNSTIYSLTSTARVDADGRYFEQKPRVQGLEFRFVKEHGQWRISRAPDGIVLSQSSFRVVFTERALYFFDPSFGYLVPDVRWFPARATVSVRIARTLLAGPASWLSGSVRSAFPVGTALGRGGVQSRGGSVVVDLNARALSASTLDRARMRQQLAVTLGVSDVVLTVASAELTADTSSAVVDPGVDAPVLVGTPTGFGFDSGSGIESVPGVSGAVVRLKARAVALASGNDSAAVLSGDGQVYLVNATGATLLDRRPGLSAPSIDPFGYVWSAQAANASSVTTHDERGLEHPAKSPVQGGSIVSLAVSRDGARLLLYFSTPGGPRLAVAGILRGDKNVPTGLGPLLLLPAPAGKPIGAAWVDDRTVATASRSGAGVAITAFEIGGASASLGQVPDATTIVGGNGGLVGIRLLRSNGEVWRPQGGGGWVSTGIVASVLATKQ